MRVLRWMCAGFVAAAMVGLGPSSALAQQDLDSVTADAAHHKVEFENSQVRVVRWIIPPGEKTAKHSHPANVNILLTDGELRLTTPDGKSAEVHAKAGAAAWRGPTVHVAENIGNKPVEGILVEPKHPDSALPAGSKDEVAVNPANSKVEFENDLVRVVRYHYAPGEKVAMHGHPDNVQVLLTDHKADVTTPDGKTVPGSGKAGMVRWRPALVHSLVNTGDKPFEGILVEMKGGAAKPAGQ